MSSHFNQPPSKNLFCPVLLIIATHADIAALPAKKSAMLHEFINLIVVVVVVIGTSCFAVFFRLANNIL